MRFLRLLGQFAIVVAWGAMLIGVVIAVWYAFSYLVLALIGRLLPLRPSPKADENDAEERR